MGLELYLEKLLRIDLSRHFYSLLLYSLVADLDYFNNKLSIHEIKLQIMGFRHYKYTLSFKKNHFFIWNLNIAPILLYEESKANS